MRQFVNGDGTIIIEVDPTDSRTCRVYLSPGDVLRVVFQADEELRRNEDGADLFGLRVMLHGTTNVLLRNTTTRAVTLQVGDLIRDPVQEYIDDLQAVIEYKNRLLERYNA